MKARVAATIEAKTFAGVDQDLFELIEANDFVDLKLDAFRASFDRLRRRECGEGTPSPRAEDQEDEPVSAFAEEPQEPKRVVKNKKEKKDPQSVDLLDLGANERNDKESGEDEEEEK